MENHLEETKEVLMKASDRQPAAGDIIQNRVPGIKEDDKRVDDDAAGPLSFAVKPSKNQSDKLEWVR